MRFIREMIARKAAGSEEDEPRDFGIEGLSPMSLPAPESEDPSAKAGFEDELEPSDPVFEEEPETSANDDAPAQEFEVVVEDDSYDEEAELDALDAAFPDIQGDANDDTVERLFPEEAAAAPSAESFEDIPEATADDEPVPQLTAADIERAMQNRKKIWHSLPEEEDDPLAIPDETNDAVTRPIRRPVPVAQANPVSVPLELVNPVTPEPAPAMEAPVEKPAEPAAEMQAMMPSEQMEAEESLNAVEEDAQVDEVEISESVFDEDLGSETDMVNAQDQDEVVYDEIEAEDEVLWPRATQDALETEVAPEPAPEPVVAKEPEAPPMETPDIQALMARAALEAAGNTESAGAAQEEERPKRRAGRVKTRLLGFQADEQAKDIFETAEEAKTSQPTMFPVGWIVIKSGPGRGASFALQAGVSLIGRGEDQAICLDFGDNSISRNNHASIAFDDESGEFFLGHGGKSNIVRLNGKPVLSTEDLSDGDEVRLGETTLRFTALCGPEFSWNNGAEDGSEG